MPCRDVFAVFAAPVESIALRQRNSLAHGLLRILHRARQVPPLDAELDTDVAGVIFPVD